MARGGIPWPLVLYGSDLVPTILPGIGFITNHPMAIGASGNVVYAGGNVGTNCGAACWARWVDGSLVGHLGPCSSSSYTVVTDCDPTGSFAVGYAVFCSSNRAAYRWIDGIGTPLEGMDGYADTRAYGVDDALGVIVGGAEDGLPDQAVIWHNDQAEVLADHLVSLGLDLSGWTLQAALEVTGDGRVIVGRGRFGGASAGFVAELWPAPSDCEPDLTADGLVDTNDFFAFLALYQAMDARADFAPGGGINIDDFFAFLASYQLGC